MVNLKNHSFKQFIYFSAPLRIFSKFFFKDSLLDVRNVTFEPGIYWLGSGHRHKFLVGESAPATAKKKTFSDKGAGCPDLLDIESNFTLYRERLT